MQITPRVCTLVLFILSFCRSVCLSGHAILAVRAIISIMKDTIVLIKRQICGNIKMAFFIKLSYSKVRAFFYLPRQGRPFLVDTGSSLHTRCCRSVYPLRDTIDVQPKKHCNLSLEGYE